MFRHLLRPLLLALLLLPLAGCDARAKDKEAIRLTWTTMKQGCDGSDGAAVVKSLTRESIEHYGRVHKMVLDMSETDLLKQPPTTIGEVIEVRCKATRKDIQKLDGAGYIAFAVSKGWWAGSLEELEITDIRVAGDFAEASMYFPEWEKEYRSEQWSNALGGRRTRRLGLGGSGVDKPPRYAVRFVKEQTGWKFDELSMLPHWDKQMYEMAKLERMHIRPFIEASLEEEEGIEVPKSAWQPMKK